MTMLENGTSWLANQHAKIAGKTVTYARNGDETEITAVPGDPKFEQADDFGILHSLDFRDFLVKTDDLVISGSTTLPRAGDRIHETINDKVKVYEVMAPGNEPSWRYTDQYEQTLRIHTKLVSEEGD